MESIYSSCTLCFDQIPNLQNCFTTPNNGRGPQTNKHLPPRPFAGQFLRKAARHLGLESISYLVHGPGYVEGENVEKDGGQPQIVVQQADVILWDENVRKLRFS